MCLLINNKFEINFINLGINNVLDDVSKEYDDVLIEKEMDKYSSIIILEEKDKNAVIKTHITEKSGIYFYATHQDVEV